MHDWVAGADLQWFEGVHTNPPSLDTSSLEVLQNTIIQVHEVKVAASAAGVAECGLWHMRVKEPPFPNSRSTPAYMRQPPVFLESPPLPNIGGLVVVVCQMVPLVSFFAVLSGFRRQLLVGTVPMKQGS